ncbi:hypothetical protein VITU102760_18580 [Vibrio tubiashii]
MFDAAIEFKNSADLSIVYRAHFEIEITLD